MSERFVKANPYPWPYNGNLRPSNTALIVIDMQTDFCGKGGYVDSMGYDINLTRPPIMPIASVLAKLRSEGVSHPAHARRASGRPCRFAGQQTPGGRSAIGAGIGDAGPCGKILVRGRTGLGDHPRTRAEAE